jgi:hypothetical protein
MPNQAPRTLPPLSSGTSRPVRRRRVHAAPVYPHAQLSHCCRRAEARVPQPCRGRGVAGLQVEPRRSLLCPHRRERHRRLRGRGEAVGLRGGDGRPAWRRGSQQDGLHPAGLQTFLKLNKKNIAVPDIREFSWSPSDNIIAYWAPETTQKPARLAMLSIPETKEITTRNIFQVVSVSSRGPGRRWWTEPGFRIPPRCHHPRVCLVCGPGCIAVQDVLAKIRRTPLRASGAAQQGLPAALPTLACTARGLPFARAGAVLRARRRPISISKSLTCARR